MVGSEHNIIIFFGIIFLRNIFTERCWLLAAIYLSFQFLTVERWIDQIPLDLLWGHFGSARIDEKTENISESFGNLSIFLGGCTINKLWLQSTSKKCDLAPEYYTILLIHV